ncbi:MAG TPA: NAD-dependent epimerase/dehydratase family protein, partial [Dongiaceae bacterium]|nr:NAD-dependent epimerase/dehydratase family protein [Dongiaceae bacterium]
MRANVEGTRSVLAAARAAGVPRAVHTSSVAAIGVRGDGAPADETYQSPPERLVGVYKRSKYLGEQEARRAFEAGQDVVIVNPSTPVGPWDAKPTPTGEIVVRFLSGRMPAYVDTGLNVIDVRDVAAGHVLAYERGRPGERYILGNENLTLRALLERLAPLAGRPAPRVRLPAAIPLAYAALGEHVLARFGVAPDVAVESVRMARQKMYYSAEKAVRELGLPQSPVTRALADAVTWFRDHGYVARGSHRAEDGWRSLSSKP